jgi:hypothetical protein
LQILIDVLRQNSRGINRDHLYRLLQPEPLAGEDTKFPSAKATVAAAIDLGLAQETAATISLSAAHRAHKDAANSILRAIDDRVLSTDEIEKYFATFYAYVLGLGTELHQRHGQNNEAWASQFNRDVFRDVRQSDPFNATKLSGLHRWFAYVGLGWYDPAADFQPNPYERLKRSLPRIFGKRRKLEATEFMTGLAEACPELDGGTIFQRANAYREQNVERWCTSGLGQALVELHLDGVVRLNCPADSAGWSIEDAEPPSGDDFRSTRFINLELLNLE